MDEEYTAAKETYGDFDSSMYIYLIFFFFSKEPLSLYFLLLRFLQLLKTVLLDRIDRSWFLAVATHWCFVLPTRQYSVLRLITVFNSNWAGK